MYVLSFSASNSMLISWTGRKRRKKCGEERPICHHCSFSGYTCTWPSHQDLIDNRHRSSKKVSREYSSSSRHASRNMQPAIFNVVGNLSPLCPSLLGITLPVVERELLHHFLNHLLPRLLNCTWNKSHFVEYQGQIIDLVMNFEGVRYAVLASCASNKFILTCHSRYEDISLKFYSHAVKNVNLALDEMRSENSTPSDALLVSVIYLYIHDVSILSQTPSCSNTFPAVCDRSSGQPCYPCRWGHGFDRPET